MTPLGGADNADWNHSRRTCGNVEHMGNRLPRIVRQFITVVTATVTIGACHASGTTTTGGEPHLILRGAEHGCRANAGCGPVDGRYRVEGTRILFQVPSAPAQCPATLRSQQVALLETVYLR